MPQPTPGRVYAMPLLKSQLTECKVSRLYVTVDPLDYTNLSWLYPKSVECVCVALFYWPEGEDVHIQCLDSYNVSAQESMTIYKVSWLYVTVDPPNFVACRYVG